MRADAYLLVYVFLMLRIPMWAWSIQWHSQSMQGGVLPDTETSFFDYATRLRIFWSYVNTTLKEFILKSVCFHLRNKEYLLISISPDLTPVLASASPPLYSKERKQNQSPDGLELHLSFAFWEAHIPGVYTLFLWWVGFEDHAITNT